MNYIKSCIKLIWKVVSFLSIYFVVINCFSYTDKYNNIIFKCPDELQVFYHKTTLDLKTTQTNNNKKYAVILGDLSEKIDGTYLNEIEKYKRTKYIDTAIDKNSLNTLEFFAPFSFKYNFNNENNQAELFSLAIKSKPILLDDNRDLDLGCVVFGDPSLSKKLSKKNSTKSATIYILGGITVQESISCNNKTTVKQCIGNFSGINYELNKNFKAYAGLMFYQAVYADITIETKGKVIGNYGIANSPSLVFDENRIDLSNNELSGTLYNKGEIIASNAAIDISCSLLNKQNNSKFIINNQGLIKGSIILSAYQHGEIRNSGKIEKNADNQMIINPGGISQIYNYDGGIITADELYMPDRDKYNKNFRLVNGDKSQLYIDNLQIANLVNKPGGIIKTRKLTVLMRECINQGTMYAKKISAKRFNNYSDVYSDNINGNFTNNKTARLYNDTTYESLVINADFTNYGIIETQHNLNIDKHLLNYATCVANVMRISGVLNNFGYIEINESIRISEGLLFNKKGSTLQLNAANNHLNGKHFNFSNKGILNISNDLIVTTDFINEAELIVNKLSCKENRASRVRLINTSSATCKIEVLENAKIKNKGKLYIKNAKGTSYLDNYISYATLTIDKNANLIVDNLTLLDNYLTNNGKLVVVKEATIDGKIIDNKGILDLKCKTKLDNTIINSGTMLIGEINGLSKFELVNNQQSKVIFNKKIDNKHIAIDNKSIVAFNMPAVIKSYIGNNNSLLKLTLSEDHNQKILVKGNEISFAQSANILLTTPQEYSIKPVYVVKLISASKISIADINSMRENIHFYITKNETEDPNNLHQPILILNNLEIQQQSKQVLQLDLQWVSIRPTLVNNINKSYYSNKEVADIFHGVIGTNNIKLTEYNNGSSWYASGASLCIGKTSANSAINNINASSSNQALTIEVLKNYVAIGNINIVNKINADNANAVSLENFNPSQSVSTLYLIKGMFIAKDAALISTKSTGLYIDQAIEGTITNYGIIQGKNSAININTINGAIVNDGTISAEYAITANTKLTATSNSQLKSYKIINNNKIIGGLNLAGVGSHLINNQQIDASNKFIRVNAGNIDNLGIIVAGTIEVKKLYNTKNAKLNVNNLIIGKQLANYGAATVTSFNVTNDFLFLNEGSLIVTDTLKINKDFINNGDLLSQKILVDQPLILTATATLKADVVHSSAQDIKIYGCGRLILGNGAPNVTIDKNLILASDTQLLLNATVTQNSNKVIASSISINQANKSFDYTIRPGALLNCRDKLEHTKLGIINSGTLNIAVGSCVRSYNGKPNSALELKISDKAKLDDLINRLPASQGYMLSVSATAEFSNNSKIIIKLEDMFADIKQAEHKNIGILSCNNLIYNNAAVTNANVKDLIATEEYYGIDLNLTSININTSLQTTTISAILNINDNKPLANNMRRASLVLSKKLSANITSTPLSAIAWCNNMAGSASAYTNNLVIYPRYLARNTARVNYNSANGLKINFDRITTIYSQPDMPAVIIGTDVKTDNYFSSYSTNTLDIKQIDINNLVVDGGHDNNKNIADNHGLVITGINDLTAENNIHFGKNTKLLAGSNANALYLDCGIKADIINDGIIGDKNTGCALYLGYPLLGKITNNNSLIAKKTAIKIDPLTHWQNNKQLTIDNYGTIDGDIDLKNSKNIKYKISLINYGLIKNAVINCSDSVELSIDNQITGNIDISNGLIADQIKANHGTIKAKSLVITKDLTIGGTFIISTLAGKYKKLTADYLIVDELKDINLTVNNLQLRSKLTGNVILNNTLVITKNIDQQANLTVPELHIKNQSKLINHKNITILSGAINLNENNFENNGSLEINGELKLSSDFTTHGNLIADTLYLNNHQLSVDANKVVTANNIYNKSDKILLLAPASRLRLGNNVATATIKGNFYAHEKRVSISKIDKYKSNIELNAATVNLQGILKAGHIRSLQQVTFNVNKNSELLLSNIIKDYKLTLVNSSKVELRSGSILKNYIGKSGTKLILTLDVNNLSDNPILQVTDKAIFDIDSIIKLKPLKPLAKYKKINQYNKITLISAANNELKYYFNNKEIILNKKTALRLISHKLMNSYLIKMRNIQIESKDKATELTVNIAIRNVKDISELSYLEQMLAKELMGDCANDKYIEGYAWKNKVVQNYLLSNNLIISPYKLAIDKNLINYKDDHLTIGNASKALSIGAESDMPSLVIGTKITDIYLDENIRNISYDIDHLGLKSIKLTNITISGRDTLNKIDQDAIVITGNYPLTFDNSDGIFIAKNCKIIGGKITMDYIWRR